VCCLKLLLSCLLVYVWICNLGEWSHASEATRTGYKLAVGAWILLGLSWLSMILNIAETFLGRQAGRVDHDIRSFMRNTGSHPSSGMDAPGIRHSRTCTSCQTRCKNDVDDSSERDSLIERELSRSALYGSTE